MLISSASLINNIQWPNLIRMLENFKDSRILVVGDIMLDRYWWGDVDRISPEAPVPVVRLKRSSLAAGGAANVAVNAAALGAKTILIGSVGNDDEASLVRRVLEKAGVSSQDLVTLDQHPTTIKTRVVAHGQHVVRVDQEAETRFSEDDSEKIISAASELMGNVDAIVVSDYAKGVVSDKLLRQLFKEAEVNGVPVLVDPKGKNYTRYHGAALITPNIREAIDATGIETHFDDLTIRAGNQLLSTGGFQTVLITQGSEGMTLFRSGSEPVHFHAKAREVYDVTGAGDTVIATIGVGVGAGLKIDEAAQLANLAAGIVVGQIGTSSVTLEELRSASEKAEIAAWQKAN